MDPNFDTSIPYFQRPPTRLVASGTITVAAGTATTFSGTNARQTRYQIIITNLDPLSSLKVQTLAGVNFCTVFPLCNITIETGADLKLQNPTGGDISAEVTELYPDTGNLPRPTASGGAKSAGGAGTAPAGGGTAPSGGGSAPSGGGGSTSGGGGSWGGGGGGRNTP